ncbi:BRISC complex subunit Abraxas 2 [Lamellibrachia satsuma]|nr:BRISC complex subunit Abraxas 2 [Lamellibrachia satsuma]
MAVTVEGVALSSLLYEHNNSPGDQEGFLLGEVVSRVTDTISDSQINNVKEEIVTYIHSHLPCQGLFSWYSDDGHIIHEKIRELLRNNKHKEVVGWYKFRRNSSTIVSLRERAIHRHLKDVFPNIPASNFVMCLSVTLTEVNLATHTFSHTFFSFNGRSLQGMPLTVVNLGDTMHSDYKMTSSKAVSGTFHQTVKPFQQVFLDTADNLHSASHIHTMNARLQQRLVEVCNDVVQSEKRLCQLSAEVKKLRNQVNSGQPYHSTQPLHTVQAHSRIACPAIAHSRIACPAIAHSRIACPAIAHSRIACPAIAHSRIACPAIAHSRIACPAIAHSRIACPAIAHSRIACPTIAHSRIACPAIAHSHIACPAIAHSRIACLAIAHSRIACPAIAHSRIACPAIAHSRIACPAIAHSRIACPAIAHSHIACLAIAHSRIACPAIAHSRIACPAIAHSRIACPAIAHSHI